MTRTVLVAVTVGFAVTQVANVATTIYLHRTLAHRALTLHPSMAVGFRVLIWVTTGIRPRQWAAVHRKHHAFTDRPEDPHSPARLGWVRVQLTNVMLYRRVARDREQVVRYAGRDLPPDRLDRLFFDHALLGLGLGWAVLILLCGWPIGVSAGLFHVVLYLGLSGSVNAVAHTFGPRPYDNSATNVRWLAWMTAGEGLHNNHHAAPTSARFALAPGEIDLGWYPIRFLEALGLAGVRHRQPHFVSSRHPADRRHSDHG